MLPTKPRLKTLMTGPQAVRLAKLAGWSNEVSSWQRNDVTGSITAKISDGGVHTIHPDGSSVLVARGPYKVARRFGFDV